MRTGLTPREIDVLRLLVGGNTNPQIAKRLGISVETVKRHVYLIMCAKNKKNRTELAVAAIANPKWFEPVCLRCGQVIEAPLRK